MSVFLPILAEHAALTLTPRTQIHASRARLTDACREMDDRCAARAMCGVDAKVIAHRIRDTADVMIADWPAPAADRCPDCARLTGIDGRQRKGSHHWQNLVDEDQVEDTLLRLAGIPGDAA